RGKGLLLLIDFGSEPMATQVKNTCLTNGLMVTQTNGTGIRVFPALTIEEQELEEGLAILDQVIAMISKCS
ncbi:MAG: aspartate aminotransferase family protein, partial [Proteobacteria bacterium]|nr:aspartate aminotransferase family protein [Pseudomonadota bacterium]